MQAKVEIIDPAYAKQLLEQGVSNRPISETAVLRYARDMKEGRWENNGQTIVLTAAGHLLDGQHRMHAIIRANMAVGMLVVRGVDEATFVTMDSGRARQLKDVLAIQGFKSATQLAAIARMAFNYIATTNLRSSPTKPTLSAFVGSNSYLSEIATHILANSGKGPVRKLGTPLSAVLFLANSRRRYDPEVFEFHDALVSGQGLFRGDPRFALREWIINHASNTGSLSQDIIFSACAKAWNAHVKGDAMKIVRPVMGANRETLPIMGFERSAFPNVRDEPRPVPKPILYGKNTAHLQGVSR